MESNSKTLVVDVSIARAAINEESVDQTAICCVRLLQTIFNFRYKIAMSEEIENEWSFLQKNRRSAYANKWRVLMEQRERMTVLYDTINNELRNKIMNSTPNSSTQTAMQKDMHLLEAALLADKIVFSRDKKCRRYFQQAARDVAEIRPIHWANPELSEDDSIVWLKNGTPNEAKRQLGYVEQAE